MSILPFEPKVPPIKHGLTASYYHLRCRCAECSEAARMSARERRSRHRAAVVNGVSTLSIVHGHSGYANYYCRCAECRAGNTRYYAQLRAQLKEQYPEVKGR